MTQTVEPITTPNQAAPRIANAIGPRRWIVGVRNGLALMMLAGVVSAAVAYFPVGRYYDRPPKYVLIAVAHVGLALLPTVGGVFGAWLVTRAIRTMPEPSPWWLRAVIRAAVIAGAMIACVFAVSPALWASFDYDLVHRVVTLLLVLANGCLYLHLGLLARRMSHRLLVVPCTLLGVLLPALLLWADLWRLAIGLETYGRMMLLTAVPVIGTGLPQTARHAGMFASDSADRLMTSQVLLLYAIAILAMLVMFEVRRVLKDELAKPTAGA